MKEKRTYLQQRAVMLRVAKNHSLIDSQLEIILYLGDNGFITDKTEEDIERLGHCLPSVINGEDIGKIAGAIEISQPIVSSAISYLWIKGKFVYKVINREEQRHRLVSLNPKGKKLYDVIKDYEER